MQSITKAFFLLSIFVLQGVLASNETLQCGWVMLDPSNVTRKCEAIYSHPVCNVTCTSSSCNRGYDYEVDCSNSTNTKTECPVCEVHAVTTCPSDCSVVCDPLTTDWDCEDPERMIKQRPELAWVCENATCVSSASSIGLYAAIIVSLFV